MILLYLSLLLGGSAIAWQIVKRPFLGLLLMLAVNPLEDLFTLPAGLSAGRLVGTMVVIGWVVYLGRSSKAGKLLRQGRLIKIVWAFPILCIIGVMASQLGTAESVGGGYSAAISISLLAIMALMIENLVDNKQRMNQLMLVVVLSSTVAAIFPLAYFLGVDIYSPLGIDATATVESGRALGLTNNPNGLGLATSMGLFALIIYISAQRRLRDALLFSFIALVMIGGLILSGSRTHLIAFMACIIVFGFLRVRGPKKVRLPTAAGALALLALLILAFWKAPEDLQERFILVGDQVHESTLRREAFVGLQRQHALELLSEHPLLGVGLKNFQYPLDYDAHDTISMLMGETGLFGTLSALWLVASVGVWLYRGIKTGKRQRDLALYNYSTGLMASLVAMLIAGLGGYVMFYQRWFWITAGMSAVMARWAGQEELVSALGTSRREPGAFIGEAPMMPRGVHFMGGSLSDPSVRPSQHKSKFAALPRAQGRAGPLDGHGGGDRGE